MCSNTSSSSGGGCNGGNGNGGVWSSSGLKIKQQKRPKVPKRGPGVAELEKIIREQNGEGFSSPCFSNYQNQTNPCNTLSLKPHPPPPPPPPSPPSMTMTPRRVAVPASHSISLPSHVPLAPKFDHLSPSTPPNMASLYGNGGGYGSALGRSNSGSGLVLPEQPCFPMSLSSCRSSIDGLDASQSDSGNSSRNLSSESNPLWSYPPLIPKRHNAQCPPPMMNQFLGSGTPAPPSPTSLPAVLHNNVEPPSNQSSYYNNTGRPASEEQKIVGMKRPHPLSMSLDNSLVPPSQFQYSPNLPPYNRPHQSSPNDSFTSNESYCRDAARWGSTLELNGKRFNYDNGGSSHASFPTLGAPSVPSPPMHMFQGEFSKCNVLPYQVPENLQSRMEDPYQRLELSNGGSDHKPFYSFLEVKEQLGKKDAALGSNHKDCEAGSDGIDLSLKL
ncbi:hypothetical protein L6164_036783 [Bauhinia variegata]|uniref:Uncharacterized protein n=1 Tax=Bauhinia variegata TaxID=167791 RepID=A0ACB9KI56_BAUVA|nr:hypothetical protein L6164_036783 [Bauhinia variegata]